jgi:putative transcriptional regulator
LTEGGVAGGDEEPRAHSADPAGHAQGQLADVMGVSRQTINSIENGRYTPSLPLALALARYLGVTVEEMFDDQKC